MAGMVRTDSRQLGRVAGDSAGAQAVRGTRHVQRLRHALRDYFPAALAAFEELAAPDTLELLGKAPARP